MRAPTFATASLGLMLLGALSAARPAVGTIFGRVLRSVTPGASAEELDQAAALLVRADGALPSWIETRSKGTLSDPPEELGAQHWEVLERAAPRFERAQVVEHVRASLTPRSDVSWREAALELMRWHARGRELKLLAQVCGGDEALLEPFEGAVREALRRDAGAFEALRSVGILPEPTALALVRAVGTAGEPEGLPWLAEQLDEPGRTDAALLEIVRLSQGRRCAEADEVARQVRPFLRSDSIGRRRQAMQALAALGDEACAPLLLEALEASEAGERKAAFAALRRLSGRDLPDRVDLWKAWFEAELEWWRHEAEPTLASLASEHDAEVVAAARRLGERSLRRDELSLRLAPLLRTHATPSVRLEVVRALARLADPAALGALALALDDPDEAVRRQAHAALCGISGLVLPAERERWSAVARATR